MRLRLLIATGLGSGYAPFAPGTFGSLVGVLLFWLLADLGGDWAPLAGLLVVAPLGFWAAGHGEAHFGVRDPGPVVIDEIAGQMLTLLFLPPTARVFVVGFLLFRVLDVLKPFPAGRLEALHGGAGIMADDLIVAVYANLLLHAVHWGIPGLLEPQ